jgi:hypothetical protein
MRFRITGNEKGQILIYTLIFMVLGMLLLTPLLTLMSAGMTTTHQVFHEKADEYYAADAGIMEGQWRIKTENLKTLVSTSGKSYSPYYFNPDDDPYLYDLSQTYPVVETPTQVNGKTAQVTITNEWIPKDITAPSAQKASNIINRFKMTVIEAVGASETISGKKIVEYHIKFNYVQETGENLSVNTMGAWLPAGYKYYSDSSHKSSPEGTSYPSGFRVSPSQSAWKGNQAVEWKWSGSGLPFSSIPGGSSVGNVVQKELTFFIELPQDRDEKPAVVGWIVTRGVDIDGDGNTIGDYSWNADIKVFKVTSLSGSTTVESYITQTETRSIQAAIAGDYYATGNSLLYDDRGDRYRDTLVDPSYADVTADNIPQDADVAAAYLYWTGWKDNDSTSTVFNDNTDSFSPNWDPGTDSSWSVDNNSPTSFKGHFTAGKSRELTMNRFATDLSGTSPNSVFISWDYWYTSDNQVLISPLNPDTCSNYNNWTRYGTSPYSNTAWGADTISGDPCFRAHSNGSSGSYLNLTLTNALSLGTYAGRTVNISWKMWKSSSVDDTDRIYLEVSNNNFGSSYTIATISGDDISTTRPASNNFSYALPSSYVTNSCKVRFRLSSYSGSNEYCYLDDITVTVAGTAPGTSDKVDFTLSSDGINFDSSSLVHAYTGTAMRSGSGSKRNYSYQIPTAYLTKDFRIKIALVGFADSNCHISNIIITAMQADKTCVFKIDGRQVSLDNDGLPRAGGELTASKSQIIQNYLSGPDGYSYVSFRDVTALVRAYCQPYPITDPEADRSGYARYSVSGVDFPFPVPHSNDYQIEYAGWSIVIIYTGPSTLGHQLYLYDTFINSSDPAVVFSKTPHGEEFIDFNGNKGLISGFVVPDQIKQAVLSIRVTDGGSGYTSAPAVNIQGGGGSGAVAMAKISGGRVTSVSVWNGGTGYLTTPSLTFSGGGGSGAVATVEVGDEKNAAKMTCFVGEGDNAYQGDYVKMNSNRYSTPLWDGSTSDSRTDVWNGKSYGGQFRNGIDIDTLGIDPTANPPQYITWASGILQAGDTSAQVDIHTDTDIWNLIYIILSFRSTVVTGGDLSYLVH